MSSLSQTIVRRPFFCSLNPPRRPSGFHAAVTPSPLRPSKWAVPSLAPSLSDVADASAEANQDRREGSYEQPLVQRQARKRDDQQDPLSSLLPTPDARVSPDVLVVGAGPAGLALAAELGAQGLRTTLVGDAASIFTNNYGVWADEFQALGLEHTLEHVWGDAVCYFSEGRPTRVGRAYARVDRQKLRQHLVEACQANGVTFQPGEVVDVGVKNGTASVTCRDGSVLTARLVTLASGAAAGRFLKYESSAPAVAVQTAYGIEVEVAGYDEAFDPSVMLFMDFRRHHVGLGAGGARRLRPGRHPAGGDGVWDATDEVPSFLYAMPLGGQRVFLEETCLVAKPALPFQTLKRRLERRCAALGLEIKEVHEEEWSYIPVGGPLPLADQPITAFGAAASLVHPATGYSLARSLREAKGVAAATAAALGSADSQRSVASRVWDALWSQERRKQAAFHIFGMELLCKMGVEPTAQFFTTFFSLPTRQWRGFLGSSLTSLQLLVFAGTTFVLAPLPIKTRLVRHLVQDPAGKYLLRAYTRSSQEGSATEEAPGAAAAAPRDSLPAA
ncbi:LCYE1 [Auxenochlorella protothecoides x Auxenochlorella symbiontica]